MSPAISVLLSGMDDPGPDTLRILNDIFDRVESGDVDAHVPRDNEPVVIVICGERPEREARRLLENPRHGQFVAVAMAEGAVPSGRLRSELAERGCLGVFPSADLMDRNAMMSLRNSVIASLARTAPFEQFRRMVEHARDVLTVLDRQGTIIYQSPSVQEVLGFSPPDMIGQSFTDFVHPDDRAALLSLLSKYGHMDGAMQSAQYRFRDQDGLWRDLESHAVAKQLSDGDMEIIVTSRDVTHFQQALANLAERERQLSEAQRIAHLGSWRHAEHSEHIEWSSELFRIFGFEQDSEIVRTRFMDAVHEDDRASVRTALQSLEESGQPVSLTHRIVRTDGEIRYVHLLAELPAGTTDRVGIIHDITEAERSGRAFKISERRFRELFKLSPDAILLLDDENTVFDANEAACQLIGRLPEDVHGLPFLQLISPDDRQEVTRMITGELPLPTASPKPVRIHTGEHGGHAVTLHVNSVLEVDRAIRIVYVRDQKDRLEHEERLRDLSRRQGNLLERERMRISREVHDVLGQELTALRIDMSWIRKHMDDEQVLERIEQTEERARMAVETARRIAHELRPGILDDFGLAAAVSWQAKQFERRTGIAVHCVTSATVEPSDDLSTAIFRIFQELLTNVARHAQADTVDASLSSPGQNLVLTVADNGQGMHIPEAGTESSLGLLGIRERIVPWSGRLELDSVPGNGTTISVIIPLDSDETPGR